MRGGAREDFVGVVVHCGVRGPVRVALAGAEFELLRSYSIGGERAELGSGSVGEYRREVRGRDRRFAGTPPTASAELLPIMPPSVARLAVATSGPNIKP